MKKINSEKLSEIIATTYYSINIENNSSIKKILSKIKSKNEMQKIVIDSINNNYKIAKKFNMPLCQDTGTPIIFIEKPFDYIVDENFENLLNKKIAEISIKKGLRLSVVENPLSKKRKVLPNKPEIYYINSKRKNIKIVIMAKGGGSENLSTHKMLSPSTQTEDISNIVIETVKKANAKGCPPYILGICIGGDFASSTLESKKVLTGYFNHNKKNEEKLLSERIMKKSKKLNIGIHGLGFGPTLIDCRVKILPCHIASLPLAISFQCFQERVKKIIL